MKDDGGRYGLRRIGVTRDDLESDARVLWRWSKAPQGSVCPMSNCVRTRSGGGYPRGTFP